MDEPRSDGPGRRLRPWQRISRKTFILLAIVVVILVAARLALPSVLRRAINARLERIPDYTGWVDSVGVSLYRGAYTIQGLVIQKRDGQVTEPYLRADKIGFSVAWRELLRGKFVADIALQRPVLTLVEGASATSTQVTADRRWRDAMHDIFPIDITRLKITDGELRYINSTTKPQVDIRVAHIQALASGLRNRSEERGEAFPATIKLQGETIGRGILTIRTQIEPLAQQPHFLLKLQLEQVSLPALNEFLRAYAGIDVRGGIFNGYVEASARQGRFQGYFKPFFDQVDFRAPEGKSRNLKDEIWTWLVSTFATVFKNHPRDEVATKIPFSGEFKNLDVHVWETVTNLLHHAFISPLQKKLDSQAPGGAGTKEGVGKKS